MEQNNKLPSLINDNNILRFVELLADRYTSKVEILKDLQSLDFKLSYPTDSIVLISDGIKNLCTIPNFSESLARMLKNEKKIILVDEIDSFLDISQISKIIYESNLPLEFLGYTKNIKGEIKYITILSESIPEKSKLTPDDFRVVALISTYNEIDVIEPVIKHLLQNKIDVYIIDNWSTDGTFEKSQNYINEGVIGVERWPKSGPLDTYAWTGILERKEELSAEIQADWFIHHDADEIRESPWENIKLRDAIYFVNSQGFNAIDFTVLNFPPIDNTYQSGSSLKDHFTHFRFGGKPSDFRQVKAWKKSDDPIDLVTSGGHNVDFPDKKVFPYNFLLKHYPIRSQEQAIRKIFMDRKPRWDNIEKQRGWHNHYDSITLQSSFIKNPKGLIYFDENFYCDYLLERLSGIGIAEKEIIDLKAQIMKLEKEIEDYKLSTSWKITRPLRKIGTLKKRLKHRH